MTRLTDTQLVILSAAAQRDDLSVLPLPDSRTLKGGALNKVMDSLRNRGLIRVLGGDGRPERVVITGEGIAAIGVESDDDETPAAAHTAPTSAEADSAADAPAPASEAMGAKKRAKAGPARGKGKTAKTTARATSAPKPAGEPSAKPTPRTGTKQALMIEMLKRPEGATVEQIAAATGWQHHTIRGAISGALKKKLGLTVEATSACRRFRLAKSRGYRHLLLVQHEVVPHHVVGHVDGLAVGRLARRLPFEVDDQRFLYREHGIGIEVLIAVSEQMGHDLFVSWRGQNEMDVCRPHVADSGLTDQFADRTVHRNGVTNRNDGAHHIGAIDTRSVEPAHPGATDLVAALPLIKTLAVGLPNVELGALKGFPVGAAHGSDHETRHARRSLRHVLAVPHLGSAWHVEWTFDGCRSRFAR
jgi:hypothetical protein